MNPALTSQFSYELHDLALRKANYRILQLALAVGGYDADKLIVLSPACQTNLLVLEKRKAEWVEVYLNAISHGIDLNTFADITVCDPLFIGNTELSGTKAFLTTGLTGVNNDITWTSRNYGSAGNILQVQYVNGGNSQSLTVSVVASLIRINLATNGSGVITSTAAQLIFLVSGNSSASSLISGAFSASENGTGLVTVLAATNLAGGTD